MKLSTGVSSKALLALFGHFYEFFMIYKFDIELKMKKCDIKKLEEIEMLQIKIF